MSLKTRVVSFLPKELQSELHRFNERSVFKASGNLSTNQVITKIVPLEAVTKSNGRNQDAADKQGDFGEPGQKAKKKNGKIELHVFWAYGELSKLEILSISSFLHYNYQVNLWTYGTMPNAPTGTLIRDAREVIPENRVFLNKAGSYASFSDLFRYAALCQIGGLYSDTDVIATSSLDPTEPPFLVTERYPGSRGLMVNNNVIFNPAPQNGNIIDLAFHVANRFPAEKIRWSEIGPQLITSLTLLQKEHDFNIKGPMFANPFDYWKCPNVLLTPGIKMPQGSKFIHCYNETWKKNGINKNAPYPKDSLMHQFEQKYM